MNYRKRFLAFFQKKPEQVNKVNTGNKDCPFCWGHQEYANDSRSITKDKQIDVKNHRDKHVKVGKFMVEHVDGFKNKKRIIERCPKCGGKRIKYVQNP
ncbi:MULTISPECIES: hypothetical protein [Aequorivita]|jgi:DNA-directed RNA polymerase subunit M/transcription elongation factor TFIIS|uniref:HNH endonuclease n=2 Tax=Aequorivita TaxID=153265 RepID=A0AB35YQZ9_9FLAO|nr:hypothetical protein [Aequorivita sp. Ant34-E75]WGF91640.1 hypothetical protein QCQ61_10515 [Aequorivita sp. Ant34-E75]